MLRAEGPEARQAGTRGGLRMASEGEVGPGPGGYLLSSQGSTVQGSGWGAGKSPRSLSSCSSQSRLPKGGRDFTKTWDGRACFSTPQGRQSCLLSEACPPSRMPGCGVAGPPCPSPRDNKDQLLSTGDRIPGKVLPISRGKSELGFCLACFLSYPPAAARAIPSPPPHSSQHFPATLAHPKPMENNKILFL